MIPISRSLCAAFFFAASLSAGGGMSSLKVELVASGLADPVAVTSLPNDASRLFVVEQAGRILLIESGVLNPVPYLDHSAATQMFGEEGMLNVAFHPDFANNGYLYVYYNDLAGDSVLARFQASPPSATTVDPATEVEILKNDQVFTKHNGGTLGFGPDGMLYLSTGDGGGTHDPLGNAQSLAVLFGKVLRLDVDGGLPYAIPADNPFVGVAGVREEIWAYGFRNPWRGAIDPATGTMFQGDVGAIDREELNHVVAGGNYGWDCSEGTLCSVQPGCTCPDPGFVDALLEYDHNQGCAIIGGPVYRGSALAGFDGRVFFADFCYGKVWSCAWDGTALSDQIDHTPELAAGGPLGLIPSFGQDAAGEIYFTTLFPGSVFRIAPNDPLPDCDADGTPDADEIAAGTEFDTNANGIPDSCELLLSATDFISTQHATINFLGAQPGDPVAILWSLRGIGEGPCFYDGAWCLSLLPMSTPGMPIGILGVDIAGGEGTTASTFVVPTYTFTVKVALQAVVILFENSKLSNPIQKVIPLGG